MSSETRKAFYFQGANLKLPDELQPLLLPFEHVVLHRAPADEPLDEHNRRPAIRSYVRRSIRGLAAAIVFLGGGSGSGVLSAPYWHVIGTGGPVKQSNVMLFITVFLPSGPRRHQGRAPAPPPV